jgi:hypothetical protein
VESRGKRKPAFPETGTESGHLRENWNEKGLRNSDGLSSTFSPRPKVLGLSSGGVGGKVKIMQLTRPAE